MSSLSLTDKNLYLSTTKDGYAALKALLEENKPIDIILTLPSEDSVGVSDFQDFGVLAAEFKKPIIYINSIKSLQQQFIEERPNLLIVNGWSQLIPEQMINSCKVGCIGTHPALLPKNRGRAPVAWHFINEEEYGGVTLFYLDKGCDSGPIIDQEKFEIKEDDNASTYYEMITKIGAQLLLRHIDVLTTKKIEAKVQDESKATYLLKRRPKDSILDFSLAGKNIVNQVRAVTDIYPLANFEYSGNTYFVKKALLLKDAPTYSGSNGQIAKVNDDNIWVLTPDSVICLSDIFDSNNLQVNVKKVFKEGWVLNE